MKTKGRKLLRTLIALLLSPILIVAVVAVLLYVPPIQRWVVRQATEYASRETGLDIRLGGIYISFPLDIDLQDLSVRQEGNHIARLEHAVVDLDLSRIFTLQLGVDAIDLKGTDVDTRQLIESVRVDGALQNIHLTADNINFKQHTVNLNGAQLSEGRLDIQLFETPEDTTTGEPLPWRIKVSDIALQNTHLVLHTPGDSLRVEGQIHQAHVANGNVNLQDGIYSVGLLDLKADSLHIDHPYAERLSEGFDAKHIALTNINLGVRDLLFQSEPLLLDAKFHHAQLAEQCGLTLNELKGYIHLTDDHILAKELDLQTSESALAGFVDADFEAFTPGSDKHFQAHAKGHIGYVDLMNIAGNMLPEGLAPLYPNQPLIFSLEGEGNIDKLHVTQAQVELPTAASLTVNGDIEAISTPKEISADVQLQAETQDLNWVMKWLKVQGIRLPSMRISSHLCVEEGTRFATETELYERGGKLNLEGKANLTNLSYNARAKANCLRISDFLPGNPIKALSAQITAEGHGTDLLSPKTRLKAQAHINEASYNEALISNVDASLNIEQGHGAIDLSSDNDLLAMDACAEAELDGSVNNATFNIDLSHIDLYALGITDKPLAASMVLGIKGATNLSDTHSMEGSIQALELAMADTVVHPLDLRWDINTDPMNVRLNAHAGDLDLRFKAAHGIDSLIHRTTQFYNVLQEQLAVHNAKKDTLQSFLPNMSLDIQCGNRNPVGNMLRYVTGYNMQNLEASISCKPSEGISTRGLLRSLNTGAIVLDTIRWNATPHADGLHFNAAVCNNKRNRTAVFKTLLNGRFTDECVESDITFLDASGQKGVDCGARASKTDSTYLFQFTSLNPIIAYRHFSINQDNFVQLHDNGHIEALIDLMADDGTGLKLYSTPNATAKQDLTVNINHLNIGELTEALPFMPNIRGFLFGDVHYMQADSTSTFSADLEAKHMQYNDAVMGDIGVNGIYFPNADGSHYVDGFLTHNGNEVVTLSGQYAQVHGQGLLNGNSDITHLPLYIANGFLPENLITLDGYIDGELTVDDNNVNGELLTDSMHIIEREFNIDLRVPNDMIGIHDNIIHLDDIEAYSSEKDNPMTLSGNIDLNRSFVDLALKAKSYPIINAKRKRGASTFGRMNVNLSATARGPISRMSIRGDMKVLGTSDLSYILEDSPITVEDQLADLITFCDFTDTLEVEEVEVFSRDDMDMQMNVSVDPATQLHCILSSDGSDRVDIQGGGDLILTYDSRNDMQLFGRYTVQEGTMRYSIMNIPLNNFKLKGGSYVDFMGRIDNPTLHIQADSRVKASVNDSDKPRNVAFNIGILVTETLDDMGLLFTIESPEDLSTQNELASMSEEERSRLAITMLVTGLYMSNNFDFSNGFSYTNTLNTFLQSAVNRVAGKALGNVDLNIGIENSTTQSGGLTTDYSFSFAKRFWGNRINVVVGGKVSSGKEAVNDEKTLINNVSVEYRLDRTGTRYVRLYYDRNHESLIEGEMMEMGAGLVFHRKSDKMGDLFIFKRDEMTTKKRKE